MDNSFGNTIEEIKDITQDLMNKFELSIDEDNLGLVQKPFFYLSVLEEIFGIDHIFYTDEMREQFLLLSQSDQLEFIINFLSEKILEQEIEDLSGSEIVNGNLDHIKKLLKIFSFLSTQNNQFDGKPEMIPEEDSKYENLNTYNTKSDIYKNENSHKGKISEILDGKDSQSSFKPRPTREKEKELKENINHTNFQKKNSKFKKSGLKIKTDSKISDLETHSKTSNQSKINKIEKDIEDYLKCQTNSSLGEKVKSSNRSKKKLTRLKSEMDQSQEPNLLPRFEKKNSTSNQNKKRLSLFKRFGKSKRKSANFKRKRQSTIAEESYFEGETDQLSPQTLRGIA